MFVKIGALVRVSASVKGSSPVHVAQRLSGAFYRVFPTLAPRQLGLVPAAPEPE